MKYSDAKFEPNYDELENSIIDSLSEISIASNLPVNIHSQDLVNRTISEVISAYLWTSDFISNSKYPFGNGSILSNDDDNLTKRKNYEKPIKVLSNTTEINNEHQKNLISTGKKTPQIAVQDEISDDSIKLSPKKTNNLKNQSSNSKLNDQLGDAGVKNSNKFMIPVLDLSYLQDNNNTTKSKQNLNDDDFNLSSNKKEKSSSKSNIVITTPATTSNNNKLEREKSNSEMLKSRNSDTNLKKNDSVKNEIEYLLKELKLSKNQNTEINEYYDQDNESKLTKSEYDKLNSMAVNLKELLTRLLDKRKLSKRNISVDKMTRDETQAEKIDTQKELLTFEEKHGRPQTKLEKDLMRPLYDHYRKVKRILTKNNSSKNQNDDNTEEEKEKDHNKFVNLHSLTIPELYKEKDASLIEKTKLKDLIKKYEFDFSKSTGRQLNKEDREYHKDDFERYKILKAKLKLIDALIDKHESSTNKK